MAQAKGVLPTRAEDREVLYKNPLMCGYFIGVKLDPTIDRTRLEGWLGAVDRLIEQLVSRVTLDGKEDAKVASVAVGLAPQLFTGGRFDPPLEPPAAFRPSLPAAAPEQPDVPNPLASTVAAPAGAATLDADVFFYVASVFEARVNHFLSDLAALRPDVQGLSLDRGYQRLDGTEPFGYADGLRNVAPADRPRVVFVHRDERELEEPPWADGGTYMAFMRIVQNPDAFNALPSDAERDAVIGRQKDGQRLDLTGQGVDPRKEPAEPAPALQPSAHVLKAGPRTRHDDVQIFRRGLPFVETTPDGRLQVGLNFCSFQASLAQFDVVFNDWMMNPRFPGEGAGVDSLLDPARQFTAIQKVGFFFVPPYDKGGLAAAVLRDKAEPRKPKTGRLVVHKRVVDPTDPSKRFERGGFVFQVMNAQGQPVGGEFTSESTGRAIAPEELTLGENYTLDELRSEFVQNVELADVSFTMDTPNKQLVVENRVTQPSTPYGG